MSRFAPSVLPRGFDFAAVADAFNQGRDRKHQRRRDAQFDTFREKELARRDAADAERREIGELELALRGVQRGTAPTFEGGAALPPTLEVFGASLSQALGRDNPVGRPRPGFTQLTPSFYQDNSRTPEAVKLRANAEARLSARQALIDAGVPANQVEAAIDNPAIVDNILFPRKDSTASEPLERVEGPDGKPMFVPRSQALNRRPYVEPRSSTGSYVQMADETGKPVFFNPSAGATVQPPPNLRATGGAGADYTKRVQALANTEAALNRLETTLTDTGSAILPGVKKSLLESDYENFQLQLKELYQLGVLAGPDLMLMRRVLNDPTSVTGRLQALGSGDEQTKRVLAQVQSARSKLEDFRRNLASGNQALSDRQRPSLPNPEY